MFYKHARVEYHPVGVVGAIVPWNYPFHNIFNPLTAALFAGNGIVVKVSEHAAWSGAAYGRVIDAALAAAGAPAGLVQIVTGAAGMGRGAGLEDGGRWTGARWWAGKAGAGAGAELPAVVASQEETFPQAPTLTSSPLLALPCSPAPFFPRPPGYAEAGSALVTSGVGKLIFVGSTGVGRKVMEAAAATLTPVVLELGGKDAFVVCGDADLGAVLPTALRGAFQSCGQNCAGAERFIVEESVHDEFVARAAEAVGRMRQGPASGAALVDVGAMCMPGQAEAVHALVVDAVKHGAKVGGVGVG